MTRKPRNTNTSAEDSLKGGAPEKAQAQHGAVVPAMRTEAAAPPAASAPDTAEADGAGKPAEAAITATGENVQEQPGGGVDTPAGEIPAASSSVLPDSAAPSDQSPQVDGAAESPLVDRPGDGAGGAGGLGDDDGGAWIVTCSREGGRRRIGRRWAFGSQTAEDLTEADIAALEADPSFTLRKVTIDLLLTGV